MFTFLLREKRIKNRTNNYFEEKIKENPRWVWITKKYRKKSNYPIGKSN